MRRILADPGSPRHRARHEVVVELPPLRPAIANAARIVVETIVVPTGLFALLLRTSGLVAGIEAALGWCVFVVLARWIRGRRLPGTLMLSAGVFTGRAVLVLATSSALMFLWQPIAGSVLMALLFLGSAAVGRPLTMRLARDYIAIPEHVLDRTRVRRMFRDVALLWAAAKVIDAAMSVGMLHFGLDFGLLGRGVLSPCLTALAIGACSWWGWRCLRLDGVRLCRAPAQVP